MGKIAEALLQEDLAREADYPWYKVENETANNFMSYLATGLGQLTTVDSSPITDETSYLERLRQAGVPTDRVPQQLESLRLQILERVLPVPNRTIEPSAIRTFKDRHAGLLGDFRRRVERELIAAVAIPDSALRQRRLDIFYDEAATRIQEIESAMRGARWKTLRAGVSLLAAVPGVSPLLGLAAAIWNTWAGTNQHNTARDFAYAAYTRAAF